MCPLLQNQTKFWGATPGGGRGKEKNLSRYFLKELHELVFAFAQTLVECFARGFFGVKAGGQKLLVVGRVERVLNKAQSRTRRN